MLIRGEAILGGTVTQGTKRSKGPLRAEAHPSDPDFGPGVASSSLRGCRPGVRGGECQGQARLWTVDQAGPADRGRPPEKATGGQAVPNTRRCEGHPGGGEAAARQQCQGRGTAGS